MRRRRILLIVLVLVALVGGGILVVPRLRFPPDTTPEGAYLRIASAVGRGEPEDCFAYLEQEAQDAVYSILDYGRKSRDLIATSYPEPDRSRALAPLALVAATQTPAELWAHLADERGWVRRLRRDLSGVASVDVVGQRATVVTARGTRYSFRRRPNGIWGLTLFSAELLAEAERSARDWDRIQASARDYQAGHRP